MPTGTSKTAMTPILTGCRRSRLLRAKEIYPRPTAACFGPEVSPGVDNDPRITVLIAPVPGVGGYFSSADAYPRAISPYSNQRDMIYLATLPEVSSADPDEPRDYPWRCCARSIGMSTATAKCGLMKVTPNTMFLNGYDSGGVDVSFTMLPIPSLMPGTIRQRHATLRCGVTSSSAI